MFPPAGFIYGYPRFFVEFVEFVEFVVFGGGSGGGAAYLTSRQGHAE